MKRFLGLSRLRNKLILFYIPFLLVPILTLGLYLTQTIRKSTIDQSIRFYRQSAEQLHINMMNKLNEYYSTGYDIATDPSVAEYLQTYSDDDLYMYQFYTDRIMNQISKAYYRNSNIQVHIYTPNTDLKFSGLFIRNEQLFEQKKKEAQGCIGSAKWESVGRTGGTSSLSYLMPITVYNDNIEVVGVLEMQIDVSDLKQFLSNSGGGQNIVLLTDGAKRLVVSNVDAGPQLLRIAEKVPNAGGEDYADYSGKKYLVISQNLENSSLGLSGWKITSFVPLDDVYRNVDSIQRANLVACILCILIAVPLLVLLSKTITKRLEYLAEKMEEISQGRYDITVVVPGRDEVALLGRKFNQMLGALDLLTKQKMENKLKEEQLQNASKEARILALESQINPHYLFNTLESIRMSLVLKNDRETADLIQIFAKSIRVMMDDTEQFVTLHEEVHFINDYMKIQNFRCDGRIHLQMHTPAPLLHYRIPKFLLQPLVENAVSHGLEMKEGEGTIHVSVEYENGNLLIHVRDNGVGMGEKELLALRESFHTPKPGCGNFALRNIAERLNLIYGERAAFRIESKLGKGTAVYVTLPIEKLEVEGCVQCADRRG